MADTVVISSSTEESSDSDDDTSYLNAASVYKKVVTKKIHFKQVEDEKPPDAFRVTYFQAPESTKATRTSPRKAAKSTNSSIEENNSDSSSNLSQSPARKRTRRKSPITSDVGNEFLDGRCFSGISQTNLDACCLDDSFDVHNSSIEMNSSDYVLIGSPETKQQEEDNYPVPIKIIWKSKDVVKLDIKRSEPIQKVFQHFAEIENIPVEQIFITKNDKPIRPTDTAASLDLTIIDVLEGGIVTTSMTNVTNQPAKKDNDVCKIKTQSANNKQPIFVQLGKNESFQTVVDECARKLQVLPDNIKLLFDGDQIQLDDTPESLDLENEACVDLRIINNK